MKKILLFSFLLVAYTVSAQTDTLYTLDKKWITAGLKEGVNQYLIFFQNKTKPKQTGTFIWSRAVRFKKLKTADVIEIEQKWYASDSASHRYIYSLVDRNTFLPIHHRTWSQKTGTEAYDFYSDKIVGSDSIANNSKKGFVINLTKPALNWELDLETFGLLPLKAGKSFAINFYHPGGRTEPMLYEYKVVGEAVLTGSEGVSVACWKLKIDYQGRGSATFFISKKTKEVVRMEEEFGTAVRYKVKLTSPIVVR